MNLPVTFRRVSKLHQNHRLMNKLLFIITFCCPLFLNTQFYDLEHNLSDEEKLYGLSQFWSEAKYNFAFFDQTEVNWDSAYQVFIPRVLATKNTFDYYGELQQFCALLKDGHTDVWLPRKIRTGQVYIRVFFKNINQKFYVENVFNGYAANIPIGSQLVKINGQPAKAYLQEKIIPYISASTQHELWNEAISSWHMHLTDTTQIVQMEFVRPDGKSANHAARLHTKTSRGKFAKKSKEWTPFELHQLDNGITKIDLNTFSDTMVVTKFVEALPELYKSKGIIIDLRKNGGGNSGTGAEILKYFTDQKRLIGSLWQTREHKAAYKAWGTGMVMEENFDGWEQDDIDWFLEAYEIGKGIHWYKGDTMTFKNDITAKKLTVPLIVLFGNNTGSAAEDFLVILDGLEGRATTIGQKSFGSTGQPMSFKLPGDAWARICTKKDTYPDGREFVGYGVKPDIFVPLNVEEMIGQRDDALAKAIAVLEGKM